MIRLPIDPSQSVSVTLYANSNVAQVSRTLSVSLQEGQETTFQIEGLPDGFERDSLRVEGGGEGVSILDVVPRTLSAHEVQKAETEATKRLAELEADLGRCRNELDISRSIEHVLSRFQQTVSPQHQGIKLDDFLATYTTESRNGYNARDVLEKTIDGLEREKSELGAKEKASSTGAVRLLLQAEKGEKEGASRAVEFKLTYFVYGACWTPSYDIRSATSTALDLAPLTVHYKALITNNTGEDWKSATLSLSTVSPDQPTSIPSLHAPELGFPAPIPPPPPMPAPRGGGGGGGGGGVRTPMLYAAAAPMRRMKAEVVQVEEEADHFGGREVSVQGGAGLVGVVMRIDGLVDVESDGEEHRVSLAKIDLQAKLKHIVVPTKSTSAFIRAMSKNTSSYPLLAGQTTLYVASSFSGKGFLSEVGPGEDFTVSLGVDPGVRVECLKEVRFKKTQGGFVRKETEVVSFVQNMSVENTHKTPLNLLVQYAFPRSTDAKVVVRPILPTDALWEGGNELEGKAKWQGMLNGRTKSQWKWQWDVEGSGWVVL